MPNVRALRLPRAMIGVELEDIFRKATQRVVVATFASNVHRIQQVINAAIATKRKIAVVGRSMVNVVSIASELGYLNIPEGMLIEPEEINKMAADRVVVLVHRQPRRADVRI